MSVCACAPYLCHLLSHISAPLTNIDLHAYTYLPIHTTHTRTLRSDRILFTASHECKRAAAGAVLCAPAGEITAPRRRISSEGVSEGVVPADQEFLPVLWAVPPSEGVVRMRRSGMCPLACARPSSVSAFSMSHRYALVPKET